MQLVLFTTCNPQEKRLQLAFYLTKLQLPSITVQTIQDQFWTRWARFRVKENFIFLEKIVLVDAFVKCFLLEKKNLQKKIEISKEKNEPLQM